VNWCDPVSRDPGRRLRPYGERAQGTPRSQGVAGPISPWPLDRKANVLSGIRHPTVVGDDSPKVSPDDLRGRKMDRIKTSQLGIWNQHRSAVEHFGAQQDLIEA
jgi:hypothetical protein